MMRDFYLTKHLITDWTDFNLDSETDPGKCYYKTSRNELGKIDKLLACFDKDGRTVAMDPSDDDNDSIVFSPDCQNNPPNEEVRWSAEKSKTGKKAAVRGNLRHTESLIQRISELEHSLLFGENRHKLKKRPTKKQQSLTSSPSPLSIADETRILCPRRQKDRLIRDLEAMETELSQFTLSVKDPSKTTLDDQVNPKMSKQESCPFKFSKLCPVSPLKKPNHDRKAPPETERGSKTTTPPMKCTPLYHNHLKMEKRPTSTFGAHKSKIAPIKKSLHYQRESGSKNDDYDRQKVQDCLGRARSLQENDYDRQKVQECLGRARAIQEKLRIASASRTEKSSFPDPKGPGTKTNTTSSRTPATPYRMQRHLPFAGQTRLSPRLRARMSMSPRISGWKTFGVETEFAESSAFPSKRRF